MIEKLNTIKWFVLNPKYLPQSWQIFKRKIYWKGDRYGEKEAIVWCQENACEEDAVLQKIIGQMPKKTIEKTYTEDFDAARSVEAKVPVKMGGAAGLNLLYHIVRVFKPEYPIETGVAYGWSSLAILLAMHEYGAGDLYSVDMPYVKMGNEDFVGLVVPKRLRNKWRLIRLADRQGIVQVISQTPHLDFVHYDSDKSYLGRKWAYQKLWKHLKRGGVFISDDIQDNIAFKEFSEQIGYKPHIVEVAGKYVGLVVKK
ncbi:MAG: class I SAM-dependent methyltransferase [Imperialibacter sp.]|uniref:class I SAM-dependent methyltransferase n=1 Tax=Imperialibacter sp. TaxID=2038411 RepID=UPI0032F04BDA